MVSKKRSSRPSRRSRSSRGRRRHGNVATVMDNRERVEGLLLPYLHKNKRVRIYLGDPETGRDWGEENDVTGFIGRSTGREPVLLLLPGNRSHGGGDILNR